MPTPPSSSPRRDARAFVVAPAAAGPEATRPRLRQTVRPHSRGKVLVTLGIAGLMGFTTVVPAYADSTTTRTLADADASDYATQTIVLASSDAPDLSRSGIDTKKLVAAVTQVAATTDGTGSTSSSSSSSSSNDSSDIVDIPKDGSIASFIKAAMAQLGDHQDCTALVERSLRAIGYSVGDLAPMGFGKYGHRVDKKDAQPGDIMMRPGHVAIYLGNGKSIDGGMPGYTTAIGSNAGVGSPYSYSVIIRLGQ